jgi:hypothetical protein
MLKQHIALALLGVAGMLVNVSHAQDCMVSTAPPEVIEQFPGIETDKLNKEKGYYSASLENGDQILVYFAPCDLALRGHYLWRHTPDSETLRETIRLFVSYMVPAQPDKEKVARQLREKGDINVNQSVTLQGRGDKHKITLQDSSSTMFVKELHYEWLPPRH